MQHETNDRHISEVEASAGSKEGVVRWVLIGGTLLAILLLSLVWIIPAMMQGDVEEEATVSGQISSQEDSGTDTDSVILGDGDTLQESRNAEAQNAASGPAE